jgi:hypothetical protein
VLGELAQELDYREFDSRYGGQNSLVSSDMKRVQDFPRTKVFDDIVGDLKIDAYIYLIKPINNTYIIL